MRAFYALMLAFLAVSSVQAQPVPADCPAAIRDAQAVAAQPRDDRPEIWATTVISGARCAIRIGRYADGEGLFAVYVRQHEGAYHLGPWQLQLLMNEAAQSREGAASALRLHDIAAARFPVSNKLVSHARAVALTLEGRESEARALVAGLTSASQRLRVQTDRRLAAFWHADQAAAEQVTRATAQQAFGRWGPFEDARFGRHQALLALGAFQELRSWLDGSAALEAKGTARVDPVLRGNHALSREALIESLLGMERLDAAVTLAEPENATWDALGEARSVQLAAMALVRGDRPAEALALIDRWPEDKHWYVAQTLRPIRACAAARAGQPQGPTQPDSPDQRPALSIRLQALLCQDREDEAAAELIAELRNPDTRWQATVVMQRYRRPPLLGVFDAQLRRRWDILPLREDVRAELERYGRVLVLDLYAFPP